MCPCAPPQFCSWVDAVILVFSLENETSFQELYQLYSQLSSQRADIPIIVVGTQGQQGLGSYQVVPDLVLSGSCCPCLVWSLALTTKHPNVLSTLCGSGVQLLAANQQLQTDETGSRFMIPGRATEQEPGMYKSDF